MSLYGFNSSVINNKPNKKDSFISLPLDFRHAMIVGETGCGKTTSAILPLMKDRIEKGHSILAFDYKGGEHMKIKHLAKKCGRLKDVVMINVPWGKNINILNEVNSEYAARAIENGYFYMRDDKFWSSLAISYFKTTLESLNAVKQFSVEFNKFFPYTMGWIPKCNIKEILDIICDQKSFSDYYYKVKDLYEKQIDINHIKFVKHMPKDLAKKFLVKMNKIKEFNRVIFEDFFKKFRTIAENSNDDGALLFKKNIPAMFNVLHKYGAMESINSNENSLVDMLNSGKIVIVNCDNLDETMQSIMLSGALESLAKRKAKGFDGGISIFIDEAQKVVSKDTDLHADVLREAKVELILAYQNDELMIQRVSEVGYKALMQNLVHKFIYKNEKSWYYDNASSLKEFECYSKDEKAVKKFKPIFMENDELFGAEKEFQTINKIPENFTMDPDKDSFLIYDETLFRTERNFISQDIKTGKKTEVDYIDSETLTYILDEIKDLKD